MGSVTIQIEIVSFWQKIRKLVFVKKRLLFDYKIMMLGSKGILESNCINCLQIVQIIPFENIKKVLFLIGF